MTTPIRVRVLGAGCPKCKSLEAKVRRLAGASRLDVEVEKVTDLVEIMNYGIMATPGLVINGILKSAGNIPDDAQILQWMKE